jgi:putative SOS response-associated peptidase YedK
MCANYRPGARDTIARLMAARWRDDRAYPDEAYPGSLAPMLRKAPDGELEWCTAVFGLVPSWAKDLNFARKTYNARTETVASKPSYRNAWRHAQWCLVPMAAFFEPSYQTGKPVRWRIERADHEIFMIAGIWEAWRERAATGTAAAAAAGSAGSAQWLLSFSLLTVNADRHPLMQRFHAPVDEKRSIAIAPVPGWLDASPAEVLAMLATPSADAFVAAPDPRVRRSTTAVARSVT